MQTEKKYTYTVCSVAFIDVPTVPLTFSTLSERVPLLFEAMPPLSLLLKWLPYHLDYMAPTSDP
jgi:hypothetical protein